MIKINSFYYFFFKIFSKQKQFIKPQLNLDELAKNPFIFRKFAHLILILFKSDFSPLFYE